MDTYMDTEELLNKIKEPYFKKHTDKLPLKWLADEDEIVDKVINEWSPEKCIGVLKLSSEALEHIFGRNPLFSENPDIELDFEQEAKIPEHFPQQIRFSWRHFLDIAANKNWSLLGNHIKDFSSSMIVLGYVLIYYLTTAKIYLYLGKHAHNLDTLYIKYANILEQDKDPNIAKRPKESLDRIVLFIKNIRKREDKYSDNLESNLWEAIQKAFPTKLDESIRKCIYGDRDIDHIPNAVANKGKTEYSSNYEEDTKTLHYDKNVSEESQDTFKDLLVDHKEIGRDKLVNLRNFKAEITKLLSLDNEVLTDRQKQVIKLVIIDEHKKVDAAKELGIDESVVRQHLKYALKNLRNILADYNK